MDKFYILESLWFFTLSWGQMTVDKCHPSWIDLQEKHYRTFMAWITFKSSFNVKPFKMLYLFGYFFCAKYKWRNTDQIMACINMKKPILVIFKISVYLRIIKAFKHGLWPIDQDCLVISQQDVITVQLNNFL